MDDPGPSRLERLLEAHARLKKRIHSFRAPIKSKAGLFAMGCVYLSVPVVAGYFVMEWSNGAARRNLGEHGELLLARKREWEAQANPAPTVVMARTPEPVRAPGGPAKQL
jgi:hypothetical protein